MLWARFVAASLLGGAAAVTAAGLYTDRKTSDLTLRMRASEATRDASPLVIAENILPLKRTGVQSKGSSALHKAIRASSPHTAPLIPYSHGASYAIDIDFGGQTFEVVFDTGSSELWLAKTGVHCLYEDGSSAPLSACHFGPLAGSTFQDGRIADENLLTHYGDGEYVTGALGYENVGIANITVQRQEVALVSDGYWNGDGVASGLIGFAYPSLTRAYEGTNARADRKTTRLAPYNPWIFNAIAQNLTAPMFSLAIDRGPHGGGGQLALGGLPSVAFNHTFASTPLKILDLDGLWSGARNYSQYAIVPDGFMLQGATRHHHADNAKLTGNDFPMIVDSGTTALYLSTSVAAAVNAKYNPPAVVVDKDGMYGTACNAKPPSLAVRIGGSDFHISGNDLRPVLESKDPRTGKCLTPVQASKESFGILGDVFLKNVVAVFDIGASEMRFAPRVDY
ncbi:hypothetical protein LTR53_005502 [Teratosphaeriaceae sp. CCFEE 6253]|nr:hypothetical protein LTR53_005502 [Teratosphaeriaceae sp. CCFEE 6253]